MTTGNPSVNNNLNERKTNASDFVHLTLSMSCDIFWRNEFT